ncbi:MAG: hypothetical protein ACYDAK_05060 [Candidatus Limnocylindrales bacterium]
MIVVVGSPIASSAEGDVHIVASGMAVAIARAAVRRGSTVEVVGRLADDPIGDAVLMDLTRGGLGHAAILRAGVGTTPVSGRDPASDGDLVTPAASILEDAGEPDRAAPSHRAGPPIEAGDLDLALRYLASFDVLILGEAVDEQVLVIAREAAGYSGAWLVVVGTSSSPVPTAGDDATWFEAPDDGPSEEFANVVGAYAAALDRGTPPREAFEGAVDRARWDPVRE